MSAEIEITGANFESETRSGVTPVDFWATWCGPCQMRGTILQEVAEQVAGKARVGKCNVDAEQSLAGKFEIRSIPTLIVFKNGKKVERLIGLQSEKVLLEKLNTLAIAV